MQIDSNLMVVVNAVMLLNMRPATGSQAKLPVDQLTYIVSGAHLEWTSPGDRLRATKSGEYVARNVVPARMAMRHDGTMYLAMPRFRRGVPFTLGAVEHDPYPSTFEPPISPYPSAAAHRPPQPNPEPGRWTMINVVDVYLDDNGVLWALDVGKVNLLDNVTVVRPPMVFAFDTDTDKMVRAIDFSLKTTAASRLQSIVVDYTSTTELLVYVTDAGLGNVIVYDVDRDRFLKAHVPACSCDRPNDLYMALVSVKRKSSGGDVTRYKRLYVTHHNLCDLMYVPVYLVDESTTELNAIIIRPKPFVQQMVVLGSDRGSEIYFLIGRDIHSWNVNRPFCKKNFRSVRCSKKSRTPLMVTIGYQGYMWLIENNFEDFINNDIGCMGVSTRIETLHQNSP